MDIALGEFLRTRLKSKPNIFLGELALMEKRTYPQKPTQSGENVSRQLAGTTMHKIRDITAMSRDAVFNVDSNGKVKSECYITGDQPHIVPLQ
jgi:hypothetical protein